MNKADYFRTVASLMGLHRRCGTSPMPDFCPGLMENRPITTGVPRKMPMGMTMSPHNMRKLLPGARGNVD